MSLPEWNKLLNPREGVPGAEPLEFLRQLIDAVEIDASFWSIPSPDFAERLLAAVSGDPEFRFSLTMHRAFSHDRDYSSTDVKIFSDLARPFLESGRLAAVLVRFPDSFHYRIAEKGYIKALKDRFPDLPLAVEVRHWSFREPEFPEFLAMLNIAWAYLDRPLVETCLGPDRTRITASIGYIRMLGRNRRQWFGPHAGTSNLDYLYSKEELREWAPRIRRISDSTDETFIFFNNTPDAMALVNALQMKALISGLPAAAPAELMALFPGSEDLLRPFQDRQTDLFRSS